VQHAPVSRRLNSRALEKYECKFVEKKTGVDIISSDLLNGCHP
jgi:hypothetical protein